jgi:hypothetical protein
MSKNDNPFAIRKSPVELITVQTLTLDDYVKRSDDPFKSCMSNKRS